MTRTPTDTTTPVVHLSNGNLAGGELLAAAGPFSHQTSDPDKPSVDRGKDQGAPEPKPHAVCGWWIVPGFLLGIAGWWAVFWMCAKAVAGLTALVWWWLQ